MKLSLVFALCLTLCSSVGAVPSEAASQTYLKVLSAYSRVKSFRAQMKGEGREQNGDSHASSQVAFERPLKIATTLKGVDAGGPIDMSFVCDGTQFLAREGDQVRREKTPDTLAKLADSAPGVDQMLMHLLSGKFVEEDTGELIGIETMGTRTVLTFQKAEKPVYITRWFLDLKAVLPIVRIEVEQGDQKASLNFVWRDINQSIPPETFRIKP